MGKTFAVLTLAVGLGCQPRAASTPAAPALPAYVILTTSLEESGKKLLEQSDLVQVGEVVQVATVGVREESVRMHLTVESYALRLQAYTVRGLLAVDGQVVFAPVFTLSPEATETMEAQVDEAVYRISVGLTTVSGAAHHGVATGAVPNDG